MSRYYEIIDYEAGIYQYAGKQPSLLHILFPNEALAASWTRQFQVNRQKTLVMVGYREWDDSLFKALRVNFPCGSQPAADPQPPEPRQWEIILRGVASERVEVTASTLYEAECKALDAADELTINGRDISWETAGEG